MAKARQIVKRRRAVRNIRKITQTMQLIATARFQKAMQRALASRPYVTKITDIIQAIAQAAPIRHELIEPAAEAHRSILLTITSNRGLSGSYNTAVLRLALEKRQQLVSAGLEPQLEMVGKKGVGYFRFLGYELASTITNIEDRIAFDRVAEMAERYMRLYAAGEVARVEVAYMRFQSMGVQRPEIVQLLPLERPPAPPPGTPEAHRCLEYEFSPGAADLLAHLIPEAVKIRLYQAFNDALVSEQVARMIAMKAATDAAGDMIKFLTRQYNRARQTQITLELADIVGGAEAVK